MGKTENDAYGCSYTQLIVFGILGNILVILSMLRQKKNVLKNNYYFLVLHLACCDLAVLNVYLFIVVQWFWLEEPLSVHSYRVFIQSRYDVDNFITTLSCYCGSIKTCHQSAKIESCLWSGVPCWIDCSRRSRFAVMLYKVECHTQYVLEILFGILDFLRLFRSNNIYGFSLL